MCKEAYQERIDDFGVFEVGDMPGIFDYMKIGCRDLRDEIFNISIRDGFIVAAPDELDRDARIRNCQIFLASGACPGGGGSKRGWRG